MFLQSFSSFYQYEQAVIHGIQLFHTKIVILKCVSLKFEINK